MVDGNRGKLCKVSLWFCAILVLICFTYERWLLISICFISEAIFIQRLYSANSSKNKLMHSINKVIINNNIRNIEGSNPNEQFDGIMQNIVTFKKRNKK